MSSSVAIADIMGVFGSIVHETLLSYLSEEEPQEGHCNNALPHTLADLVPHLVVKSVDLLQALQIVLLRRGVGQCPDSEVVHVSHVCP